MINFKEKVFFRYAVTVIWHLDSNCQVKNVWYGRTIIKSSYKLCYEVHKAIYLFLSFLFYISLLVLSYYNNLFLYSSHFIKLVQFLFNLKERKLKIFHCLPIIYYLLNVPKFF